MMIERRFFVWKDQDNNTPVKLGDRASVLLKQQIIVKSGEKDSEFRLNQNENIWIGSENDLVYYIYFTRNAGDELLGFDPYEFDYPATGPIVEFLTEKYEPLPFENIEEVKENYSGDLLYVIFRDFNPSNIFLMRLNN